jgi:hypothetical protein
MTLYLIADHDHPVEVWHGTLPARSLIQVPDQLILCRDCLNRYERLSLDRAAGRALIVDPVEFKSLTALPKSHRKKGLVIYSTAFPGTAYSRLSFKGRIVPGNASKCAWCLALNDSKPTKQEKPEYAGT